MCAVIYIWKEKVQNMDRYEYGTVQNWNLNVYAASLLRQECSRDMGLSYGGKKSDEERENSGEFSEIQKVKKLTKSSLLWFSA